MSKLWNWLQTLTGSIKNGISVTSNKKWICVYIASQREQFLTSFLQSTFPGISFWIFLLSPTIYAVLGTCRHISRHISQKQKKTKTKNLHEVEVNCNIYYYIICNKNWICNMDWIWSKEIFRHDWCEGAVFCCSLPCVDRGQNHWRGCILQYMNYLQGHLAGEHSRAFGSATFGFRQFRSKSKFRAPFKVIPWESSLCRRTFRHFQVAFFWISSGPFLGFPVRLFSAFPNGLFSAFPSGLFWIFQARFSEFPCRLLGNFDSFRVATPSTSLLLITSLPLVHDCTRLHHYL